MTRRRAFGFAAAILAPVAVALALGADAVFAQGGPFGMPRPAASPPAEFGGIVGYILAKQAEFYRAMSGLIRAAKADGAAVWGLLGVSFLYGVFHAAGPGHGKAVISSYLLANEETWRRGIALSFASALLQALVAVALVGVAAIAFNATRKTMDQATYWIEVASYGLIALLGARLTWTKGRAFFETWRSASATHAAAAEPAHGHSNAAHGHDLHNHDLHGHDAPGRDAHTHEGHQHDAHCGHSHGPDPAALAGKGGWTRGLAAVVAVGLRPCSGAILVLVFALAQGLFWAGVASTFVMGLGTAITVAAIATFALTAKGVAARFAAQGAGGGALAIRGLELAAAVAVFAFGAALLTGYMVAERIV